MKIIVFVNIAYKWKIKWNKNAYIDINKVQFITAFTTTNLNAMKVPEASHWYWKREKYERWT